MSHRIPSIWEENLARLVTPQLDQSSLARVLGVVWITDGAFSLPYVYGKNASVRR